jgi:hypothetical protein
MSPVSSETRRQRSTEEEDRKVFDRLVKYLDDKRWTEEVITMMEKRAKCPFRTLSFGGVTQVVCDFSDCSHRAVCPGNCLQAFAYLNLDTKNITREEPQGDYEKVYIGCIYEDRNGIQSEEPTAQIS